MSLSTSNQIISKSSLIKAVLNDILLDVNQDNQLTFTVQAVNDIKRALTSCSQLIDLGKLVADREKELKSITS